MRKTVFGLALSAMLFALCLPAHAQQPARLPRVGVLLLNPLSSRPQQLEAFRQGLRAHGYVEGQNIVIETTRAVMLTGYLRGVIGPPKATA
jgi:hypothetical protein